MERYQKRRQFFIKNIWSIIFCLLIKLVGKKFKNCLIRHPKQVIVSYSKKSKINSINDLGFVQQVELFEQIKNLTGRILL